MEATFAEYVVHEDDRVKIWFAGVDSFKVRVFVLVSFAYFPAPSFYHFLLISFNMSLL